MGNGQTECFTAVLWHRDALPEKGINKSIMVSFHWYGAII